MRRLWCLHMTSVQLRVLCSSILGTAIIQVGVYVVQLRVIMKTAPKQIQIGKNTFSATMFQDMKHIQITDRVRETLSLNSKTELPRNVLIFATDKGRFAPDLPFLMMQGVN